jgi:hypothetical protein
MPTLVGRAELEVVHTSSNGLVQKFLKFRGQRLFKHNAGEWSALSSLALSSAYSVTVQTPGNHDARLIYR